MSYRATVYFEDYALRTGVVEPQLPSGQSHVALLSGIFTALMLAFNDIK